MQYQIAFSYEYQWLAYSKSAPIIFHKIVVPCRIISRRTDQSLHFSLCSFNVCFDFESAAAICKQNEQASQKGCDVEISEPSALGLKTARQREFSTSSPGSQIFLHILVDLAKWAPLQSATRFASGAFCFAINQDSSLLMDIWIPVTKHTTELFRDNYGRNHSGTHWTLT